MSGYFGTTQAKAIFLFSCAGGFEKTALESTKKVTGSVAKNDLAASLT